MCKYQHYTNHTSDVDGVFKNDNNKNDIQVLTEYCEFLLARLKTNGNFKQF